MNLQEIRDIIASHTPESLRELAKAIGPAIVKVMSFESRDYPYIVGSSAALYQGHIADLGVWHDSLDED